MKAKLDTKAGIFCSLAMFGGIAYFLSRRVHDAPSPAQVGSGRVSTSPNPGIPTLNKPLNSGSIIEVAGSADPVLALFDQKGSGSGRIQWLVGQLLALEPGAASDLAGKASALMEKS